MNINEIFESLMNLGFDASINDDVCIVKIGATDAPFITVVSFDPSGNHINVTCQVAVAGDFSEENLPVVLYKALCENSRIRPFAFEIIDSNDDPSLEDPRNFPIVLGDSVPVIDLSEDELDFVMQKLVNAISSCKEVFSV